MNFKPIDKHSDLTENKHTGYMCTQLTGSGRHLLMTCTSEGGYVWNFYYVDRKLPIKAITWEESLELVKRLDECVSN